MKIKDLPDNVNLGSVWFKHPETGESCLWVSQWGYPGGKAGVFYRTDEKSNQIFPLCLNKIQDALKLTVIKKKSKL